MISKKRFELIDTLKGFSIFTIIVMHLIQGSTVGVLRSVLSLGGAGVHVFLLCSGFGLYLSYLSRPLDYLAFLKRRGLKVYLPYAIVIVLSAIIPFYYLSPEKWTFVASHLLLFKMFVNDYESTFGSQMWFVSTIFQFYLLWPIIVKCFEKLTFKNKFLPLIVSLLISLLWATIVAILQKEDLRIWNSFCLQYMWEFVLGMFLARLYKDNPKIFVVPSLWKVLLVGFICLSLSGAAGLKGGIFKVYNDVPSMVGYTCMAIVVCSVPFINRFFKWSSCFSYELYLVHELVYGIIAFIIPNTFQSILYKLIICLPIAYVFAFGYSKLLKKIHLK